MISFQPRPGLVALLDPQDEHLSRIVWGPQKCGSIFYLRRTERKNGHALTVFIHHAVIGRPLDRRLVVDHINGDGLDNRRCNLRVVGQHENSLNNRRTRGGGLPGSFRHANGHWYSKIVVAGKTIYLGKFFSAEKASAAYWAKLREVRGGK